MTGFVPESPIFSSLPFYRMPEDHRSNDRLQARVPFVGNSGLHDAVLPLFEGARPRTQRRPPCFSVGGEQQSARCCPPVVQGGTAAYPARSSLLLIPRLLRVLCCCSPPPWKNSVEIDTLALGRANKGLVVLLLPRHARPRRQRAETRRQRADTIFFYPVRAIRTPVRAK